MLQFDNFKSSYLDSIKIPSLKSKTELKESTVEFSTSRSMISKEMNSNQQSHEHMITLVD